MISHKHYLQDTDHIVCQYYDEVFWPGHISESSFDSQNVVIDIDSGGKDKVSRRFGISKENCQRAKVLSAKTQRLERIEIINNMVKLEEQKQVNLFLYEEKKYELNMECEKRLLIAHCKLIQFEIKQETNNTEGMATTNLIFTDILALLTVEHF